MSERRSTKAKFPQPKDQFINLTPVQKMRSVAALKAIKSGAIQVPVTCGWCGSTVVDLRKSQDELTQSRREMYHCSMCGKLTRVETARSIRRQKIRQIILDGIDPRMEKSENTG